MFYEQLKNACKARNTSVTAVLKKMHIGTANGTYWKNGSSPSSDIVIQLAEFLNVSTDYLLTGKEDGLRGDERELLDDYNSLNAEEKKEAVRKVAELKKNGISENKPTLSCNGISRTNGYEQELILNFRKLSFEEQMRLIGRIEAMAEMSEVKENIG
ncbi:MAG: helix-turn-helix transcriptional regulator [Ruminococcus sp.]|nr:helix-turn-helix transcriptional regulator [Ruminococcus sp.]